MMEMATMSTDVLLTSRHVAERPDRHHRVSITEERDVVRTNATSCKINKINRALGANMAEGCGRRADDEVLGLARIAVLPEKQPSYGKMYSRGPMVDL